MNIMKQKTLSHILALVLAVSLAMSPAGSVLAAGTSSASVAVEKAATKTVKKAMTVFQTKGVFGLFNYYGKDVFEITINPTKKTISKVKLTSLVKNPSKMKIINRKSATRKKISSKKWQITTIWSLDFSKLPSAFVKAALKKVPILSPIMEIGEFVAFQAVYEVTGTGAVTRQSFKLKLMIPKDEEDLIKVARTLYKLFLGK